MMKKQFLFVGLVCLMALFSGCSKDAKYNLISSGYVDLGLPSGTMWQAANETNSANQSGFFSYSEAVSTYGSLLPTKVQFDELVKECNWQWDDDKQCVIVVGANNNAISFPLTGYRNADGTVLHVNATGYNWTATVEETGGAWHLRYSSTQVGLDTISPNSGMSVRLAQKK